MIRTIFFTISLLMLNLSASLTYAADAACVAFLKKNNVSVNTNIVINEKSSDVQFDFSKSRRQLAGLSGTYGKYGNQIINGLTVANFRHSLASNFVLVDLTNGYSCVWPDNIEVNIGYTDMIVYVASDFGRNSCQQITTLKHELEHVSIHQSTLSEGVELVRKNLNLFSLSKFPILLKTNNSPDKKALNLLTKELNRNVSVYENKRNQLNSQLDSPSSYRYWQSMCPSW